MICLQSERTFGFVGPSSRLGFIEGMNTHGLVRIPNFPISLLGMSSLLQVVVRPAGFRGFGY